MKNKNCQFYSLEGKKFTLGTICSYRLKVNLFTGRTNIICIVL